MASFFKRLSYSIGNEDWKTEQKALSIHSTDTVFTVTASGDRPLNLLFSNCKKIIAVDANPFQTALCDLKRAAIGTLDHDEYHAFLGLTPHKDRIGILKKLEPLMQNPSVQCWRNNRQKISNGISYEGQVEKLCRKASFVIRTLEGKKIDKLFSFDSQEEQKKFVDTHWNWKNWKRVVDVACHPIFSRFFIKDPGLYKHIDASIRPPTYIYKRLEMALKQLPIKENLILSMVFQGKIYREGFSPHLSEGGCGAIKARLNSLVLQTIDVMSYLKSAPDSSIHCFSLSDIASYMSKLDFELLCKEVVRTAAVGARFCIRQFMSAHEFPEAIRSCFQRNLELEKELEAEDRCFVYRFNVGTIVKS